MKKYQDIGSLLLRFALAAGFLSAVASRLSLWGSHSSGWEKFLKYAAGVNSFLPASFIPAIAIISTVLEIVFGISLLIGYKTRYAALGAAVLTALFAASMTYSFGIKDPLDYSVFAFSASALLLASMPQYRWGIDQFLTQNN